MSGQLINWMQVGGNLFNQSTNRIIWNLFLAFIPLALSFYLFRSQVRRNIWWWLLLLIFIAFLPNAPYVLTDSIHIIELSPQYPKWAIATILIPQYTVFITLGFEAYVVSLSKLDRYLTNYLIPRYRTFIKAIAHSLCIIGVYIGRFERFNSWDFVTKPDIVIITTVKDLFDVEKLISMAIAFITIWLLTEFIELVNSQILRSIISARSDLKF